jgi:hypothetical protein
MGAASQYVQYLLFHTTEPHSQMPIQLPGIYDGWGSMRRMLSWLKHLQHLACMYTDNDGSDIVNIVKVLNIFCSACPTLQFVQLVSMQFGFEFGQLTCTQLCDWEWNSRTWVCVGLSVSQSMHIWEQLVMDVTMSGISRTSIKFVV